jgi:hypothetical protein
MDYRGSSASISENNRASTWFGSGTLRCLDPLQVEPIFRSEIVAHRQEATLRSADVITFACAGPSGPASAASSTVQVDVLVHSSKHIRRVTLESWLDPAQFPQVAEFRWKAIQTGGSSYMRNPIVQQFLEGSELDAPGAGKRLRIDLAGLSGLSPKKCGRKIGYRKPPRPGNAADASAGSAAGAGPAAAADAPSRTPRRSLSCADASSPLGAATDPCVGRGRGRGSGGSPADGLGSGAGGPGDQGRGRGSPAPSA